jgi:protein-S-isoprenylcysteine O-methyltransferase Ste14
MLTHGTKAEACGERGPRTLPEPGMGRGMTPSDWAYIVVAARLEERDLTAALFVYRDYAAVTPRFVPRAISSANRRNRR